MDLDALQDFLTDLLANQVVLLAIFTVSVIIISLKGSRAKSPR